MAARSLVTGSALAARCEVLRGGCYGLCHLGPNVVVREDTGAPRNPLSSENFQLTGASGETYYAGMDVEKVTKVVREHIAEDRVCTDLLGDPKA